MSQTQSDFGHGATVGSPRPDRRFSARRYGEGPDLLPENRAFSSTFIPADTMPGWFQPIAEYQPFTPAIETLRGLPLGTEIGNTGGSRSPGASH